MNRILRSTVCLLTFLAAPFVSAQAAPSCAGAWQLAIAEGPQEPPLRALVTFAADHTALYGETAAITSLTPGVPVEYTSPGFGVWRPSAAGCRYHLLVHAADAAGHFTRTSDIRGTVQLTAHGSTFRGPVTITVMRANGTRLVIHTGASGRRVTP